MYYIRILLYIFQKSVSFQDWRKLKAYIVFKSFSYIKKIKGLKIFFQIGFKSGAGRVQHGVAESA